jgi:hypothetical protein
VLLKRRAAAAWPPRLPAAVALVAALVFPPGARSDDLVGTDAPPVEDNGMRLGTLTLNGDISQKYRFRTTGSASDQDLYGYLNLDGRVPGEGEDGRRLYSSLNFNLQASYNLDIDSFQQGGIADATFFPLFDITDTYPDRLTGWLYSAYVEAADLGPLETTRVGRQEIHREYGVLFDGAHVRTKRWNTLSFDVFGGIPAHLYESPRGDAFAGASIESEITADLVLGADYFYISDEGDDGLPDTDDNVYLGRALWRPSAEWRLDGSFSWVDTRDRLQQVTASYASLDWGLTGLLRIARQNGVVDFQASEISPYIPIEGSYAPYYQFTLDLHQPIGEKFGVGGGFNIRQLEHSSDEGLYNHSFRNFYLDAVAAELWKGSRISVRGDFWNTVGGDDIESVGIELEQKMFDFLRVRLGTNYALYRIDLFTGLEKERDRIYYVKLRWLLGQGLDLDTDYQYEQDSTTHYNTLIVGLRKWF